MEWRTVAAPLPVAVSSRSDFAMDSRFVALPDLAVFERLGELTAKREGSGKKAKATRSDVETMADEKLLASELLENDDYVVDRIVARRMHGKT